MRWLSAIPLLAAIAVATGCGQNVAIDETTETTPTAPIAAEAEKETSTSESVPTNDEAAVTVNDTAAEAATLAGVYVEGDIAIAGADPVAYFTESAYVPGSDQFTHEWSGAVWQFASAENRDAFAGDPLKYAPQYGGYCAWAVSQGYTAPVDPEAWKVVDGKLYLNFNQNIQARWARDIPGNIAKADANWPAVVEN
ncbi:YHS domain-containing (seleno)protein [Oscillatoria sp. CS-180]|uniref:YHS domain-containing (seleno)protein n=1 Tax=Oscillatoria sp. CS-180 TaxID=3021720 RepID=UPI00232DDFC2|nr:YHS domain-containing (seleno)protein [Oscillatoria sp. CS-180]MDB9528770.1 YHS domain-containing (seleno)protein [Oscillatoria sp. CS-180]